MMRTLFRLGISLHVWLYRRLGGRFVGSVRGTPVLLLTTTGRRSGQARTLPLGYVRDGDAYVIAASANGADKDPGWMHNLRAQPAVTVEVGRQRLAARADEAAGSERERLWAALVRVAPSYDGYVRKTTRVIPVVGLVPTGAN